jgi:hypothetical protein
MVGNWTYKKGLSEEKARQIHCLISGIVKNVHIVLEVGK